MVGEVLCAHVQIVWSLQLSLHFPSFSAKTFITSSRAASVIVPDGMFPSGK